MGSQLLRRHHPAGALLPRLLQHRTELERLPRRELGLPEFLMTALADWAMFQGAWKMVKLLDRFLVYPF